MKKANGYFTGFPVVKTVGIGYRIYLLWWSVLSSALIFELREGMVVIGSI